MSRCDLRIVVVDDNRDAAYTLGLLLERSGFSVVAQISDATAALDCLKNERPDVAIVDIAMPQLDGYALARQIRAEINPAPRLICALAACAPPKTNTTPSRPALMLTWPSQPIGPCSRRYCFRI